MQPPSPLNSQHFAWDVIKNQETEGSWGELTERFSCFVGYKDPLRCTYRGFTSRSSIFTLHFAGREEKMDCPEVTNLCDRLGELHGS